MEKLQILNDGQFPIYAINRPGAGDLYTWAMTTDNIYSLPVPENARMALFGYSTSGADYYVSDASFTIPANSSPATTQRCLLNPPPLQVAFGATLYFRVSAAANITVSFYS